jgi:RNA polymerase sigma-70 factor, ECF subfamily
MAENQTKTDLETATEEDLVRAAQQDPLAFEALYLHFVKQVYRYLYSRMGSQPDAEDATAQTFLSALEGFDRYRHDGHFAAWLFAIARRKAADYFRLAGRSTFLPDDLPAPEPDLLQQADQNERLRNLMRVIRNLTEEEQELIRLRYAARLGFAEIARLMERNEDALKKSLYRLLDRLQSQLEESND